MFIVRTLPSFDAWLAALPENKVRLRLERRLQRVQHGDLGDRHAAGHGLMEVRDHFGQGWRLYYVQRPARAVEAIAEAARLGCQPAQVTDVVMFLLGAAKSSKKRQDADIAAAQKLAEDHKKLDESPEKTP